MAGSTAVGTDHTLRKLTDLSVILRGTPEHEVREAEGDSCKWPDDVHDRSRDDVLGRVDTVERVSPVPERGDWLNQRRFTSPSRTTDPKSAGDPGRRKLE